MTQRLIRLLPRSLVNRVYLLNAASLLLCAIVLLCIFYYYLFTKETDEAEERAAQYSLVVAQAIADSAVIGDYDTIDKLLKRVVASNVFRQASFTEHGNNNNRVVLLATSTRKIDGDPPQFIETLLKPRLPDVTVPIAVGGRDYGVFRMEFDPALIAAATWEVTRLTIMLIAGSVIAGLLLVRQPIRNWLGALDRVNDFERSLRAGEIDPAKALDGDIPEELRTTFDLLAQTSRSLRSQLDEIRLFATITDRSAFGVCVADVRVVDTPIIYANETFLQMSGYSLQEVVGQNCRFLTGIETDPGSRSRIRHAIAQELSITEEILNYRKNGTTFWNRLTLFPVYDRESVLTHYVGYQSDITSERANNALQEQLKIEVMEARSNRSLGQMIAGTAHEINNPLGVALTAITHAQGETRALQSHAERLQDEALLESSGDITESVDLTHRNLMRSVELVRSLKEVAVSQASSSPQKTVVRDYFQSLLLTLRPMLRRSGCTISSFCDTEATMRTELGALSQIMQNLILNAVNHAFDDNPDDKRIDVTISLWGENLMVRVQDNGRGIPAELCESLFLPFVSSKRNAGGSGLGLHIARELAERQLDGRLELENAAVGKTTFLLSFPLDKPESSPTPPIMNVRAHV